MLPLTRIGEKQQPMEPGANFWVEVDGQVVLSDWRIELLEAVAETGSISGAARKLKVPYRLAWTRLHEMEKRLGVRLLETQTGGVDGGGARLTAVAQDIIEGWHSFSDDLHALARLRFAEVFGQDD